MTVTSRQLELAAIFRKDSGWCDNGVCGVIGNDVGESGAKLDSTVHRVHADHGSGGIAEWRLDRLTNLIAFANQRGVDPNTLAVQAAFQIHEIKTGYPQLDAMLRDPNESVATLVSEVCWKYERPNKQLANLKGRLAAANALKAALPIATAPAPVHPATAPTTVALGGTLWTVILGMAGGDVRALLSVVCALTAASLAQALWRAHVESRPPSRELEKALSALEAAKARVAVAKTKVQSCIVAETALLQR